MPLDVDCKHKSFSWYQYSSSMPLNAFVAQLPNSPTSKTSGKAYVLGLKFPSLADYDLFCIDLGPKYPM
jgi:hypothetical protein